MNKLVKGLLMSTLLLSACGSNDEVVEETDAIDEYNQAALELQEQGVEDDSKESTEELETPDEYITYSRMDDIPGLVEDASEISGLYIAHKEATDRNKNSYVPGQTVLIDVRDDGTFTRISYSEDIIKNNKETGEVIDTKLQEFIDKNDISLDRPMGSRLMQQHNSTSAAKLMRAHYIDDNDEVHLLTEPTVTIHPVTIESGYLSESFGEYGLFAVQYFTWQPYLDTNGEVEMSGLARYSSTGSFFSGLLEDEFSTIDLDVFEKTTPDKIAHQGFFKNGNLKSSLMLEKEHQEKVWERQDLSGNSTSAYLKNNNELLQTLAVGSLNATAEIITDTDEYTGYTEDNEEFTPKVVIKVNDDAYTVRNEGESLKFNFENSRWEETSL